MVFIIIIIINANFSHYFYMLVFYFSYWSRIDSQFPLVSRTSVSFLANRNSAVVCMASIFPPISCSSSLLSFGEHYKSTVCNWSRYRLHIPQLFPLSGKLPLFVFFYFYSVVNLRNNKIHYFFLLLSLVFWLG